MSTFFELANQRQSCRSFADKTVEKEKFFAIVEAARLSPSACNSQPWHFVIVNNPEICRKTAQCLQDEGINSFTNESPAFIVIIEEEAKLGPRFQHIDSKKNAQIDVGIVSAHLCLAATDLGLATCIIGSVNEQRLASVLNLDISGKKRIRLVVAVGYDRKDILRKKKRKPIDEILTYIE